MTGLSIVTSLIPSMETSSSYRHRPRPVARSLIPSLALQSVKDSCTRRRFAVIAQDRGWRRLAGSRVGEPALGPRAEGGRRIDVIRQQIMSPEEHDEIQEHDQVGLPLAQLEQQEEPHE